MPQVTIYTTPFCGYCVRAKSLLQRRGIAYREIDVSRDPARRRWLATRTGQTTVPQIFIDERSIGGCDELHALEREGRLDAMLQASVSAKTG